MYILQKQKIFGQKASGLLIQIKI